MDKPPFLGLADQSVHSEDGVVVTPWGRPVMEIIFSPPPPWAQCMTMAISVACRGFCHDYLEGVQVQSNFRGWNPFALLTLISIRSAGPGEASSRFLEQNTCKLDMIVLFLSSVAF